MTEAQVYEKLTELFQDIFMREDLALTPELTAKDVPGWNSFKQIDIMLTVEERFDIQINVHELESLASVGDLAKLILAKTQH
jgi:acyl carrier protein